MNMNFLRKLPIPKDIKAEYPVTPEMEKAKALQDNEVIKIFTGGSDKFLLVIGPCSADDRDAVLDYMGRLRTVADEVRDKIVIIPRVYTNKPRTTGSGYKGMLHQPSPDEAPDMLRGIVAIRELHMAALRDYGFSCADEMLYPENYRYLSDLLGYVAVGARSVEDQHHRFTASGLDIPVGMKNPTEGDLSIMLNAVYAAQRGHTFIYRGWEVQSSGNPYTHCILRGYMDSHGRPVPNYHYEDIQRLDEGYRQAGLKNPAVLVDVNHSNSGKRYEEQIRISKDVLHSRKQNEDIKKLVKGLMIESYIEDGAQSVGECVYGKSITDPCLGWEKSKKLIYDIANML